MAKKVKRKPKQIHGASDPTDWDRTKKPPIEVWAILCNPQCAEYAYIAFGEQMFVTRAKCAAYIKAVCNNGERPIRVRIVPHQPPARKQRSVR